MELKKEAKVDIISGLVKMLSANINDFVYILEIIQYDNNFLDYDIDDLIKMFKEIEQVLDVNKTKLIDIQKG